ncbi:MAG: LysM peptidoglycan-binding domain-containing protein [Lacisediminihabitans sp.]
MTTTADHEPRHSVPRERGMTTESSARKERTRKDRSRLIKGMLNTIPIVLVGSMALSMNLTGPVQSTTPKRTDKPRTTPAELGKAIRGAFADATKIVSTTHTTTATAHLQTASMPNIYRVVAGDTVSSIAGKYGLATASVLAMNGLGWKSVIFPGQTLQLGKSASSPRTTTTPHTPTANRYTIVSGDTVGRIAAKFGLTAKTVLSANGLSASSIIYPGQTLAIPSTSPAAFTSAPVAYVTPIATPTTPQVSIGTTPVTSSYVIVPGDTISKIATKFGISIQSILNANNLSWSSIIYTGRTITIPAAQVLTTASSTPTGLTAEMKANAVTIVRVGKSLGVSDYGLVIALAAAMQESGLRNLDYGDRDSLGLFQQRPSAGWGTPAQLTNPSYASKLFFGGASSPNKGNTNGLLDITGWQSKTVTQAAQAVQKSAYPDAYAKWEASAWVWLDLLG